MDIFENLWKYIDKLSKRHGTILGKSLYFDGSDYIRKSTWPKLPALQYKLQDGSSISQPGESG